MHFALAAQAKILGPVNNIIITTSLQHYYNIITTLLQHYYNITTSSQHHYNIITTSSQHHHNTTTNNALQSTKAQFSRVLGPGLCNRPPLAVCNLVVLLGQPVEQHVVADLPIKLLAAIVAKLLAMRRKASRV
jgi:hypothetical protein